MAGRVKRRRGGAKVTVWESYEQVAAYLLNLFASEFGLERVEGKQEVAGQVSGTTWEIDAKGVRKGNTDFIIVECRRTTSKQNQKNVGGLVISILDSGAEGGIIVSHRGLQKGAKLVAAAGNIINVHLDQNSTRLEYVLSFLNKVMIAESVSVTESVKLKILDP